MSSEIDYDPQSAGHNYDWSAMSEADAIEIVLCRQEALYEALNGSKPWDDVPNDVLRPDRYEKRNGHPPHRCPNHTFTIWLYEYDQGACILCHPNPCREEE